MSFDSDPGRDDGSLPPVDVVIPDDARELARDVLAYRREIRARRRRDRMLRTLGPFGRIGFIRHGGIFPLIASCVALSLLAGTMLSVVTISPASAPTTTPAVRATLPTGSVMLDDGDTMSTTALEGTLLALIPQSCQCGTTLKDLAAKAKAANVGVYFIYPTNTGLKDASAETNRDGDGIARTAFDSGAALFHAFTAYQLTVILVDSQGTVRRIVQSFPAEPDLTPDMNVLRATH